MNGSTRNHPHHPLAHHAASMLGKIFKLPLIQISGWRVVDEQSATLSVGLFKAVSGEASAFRMTLTNPHLSKTLIARGKGLGVGVGGIPGLPVDVSISGDVQTISAVNLPKLPGFNSPIFLGPAGKDQDGQALFSGHATVFSADADIGLEIGASVCIFSTRPVFLDDSIIGLRDIFAIKALTLSAGDDWISNVSASLGRLFYWVSVEPTTYEI